MGFVGSLVGGILGSNAAGDASQALQSGAQSAQNLLKTNQNQALDFQNGVWSGTRTAEEPYQEVGSTSANALVNLLKQGFQAPTLADVENTPGYQFTLEQGTKAIDSNAAANGTLLSGNTGKALEDYGQGLASTTYGQDYQRALQTYMSNYQSLLGGTNIGLSSTGQLGQFGQEASNTTANIDLTSGNQQAAQINNAAAARASGYLSQAGVLSNMAGGMLNSFSNLDTTGSSSPLEQIQNFAFA